MTIQVFDISTEKELCRLPGSHNRIRSIAFSPDNQTLTSGGEEEVVRLWSIETQEVIREFKGHKGRVFAVAFSPDGRLLASGGEDKLIRIWDVSTGEERNSLAGHRDWVTCLAFSPDGKHLASGGQDTTVGQWDVELGRSRGTLSAHSATVEAVAFTPDSQVLASGSWDRSACLWDVKAGTQLAKLGGGVGGGIKSLIFTVDGRYLLVGGGDLNIRMWDTTNGRTVRQFSGHHGLILALALSPDGATFASGSDDRSIRLWNIASGAEVKVFADRGGTVSALAYSSDGRMLASINSGHFSKMIRTPASQALPEQKPRTVTTSENLEQLWEELASEEPNTAYGAARSFTAAPALAIPFLQGKVKPAEKVSGTQIAMLIGGLRSANPDVQEKARGDMLKLGSRAELNVKQAMMSQAPGEIKQRMQDVLDQLRKSSSSGETLRELRVVSILIRINSLEARQFLQKLAGGAPDASLTKEAQAAVKKPR